MKDQEKNMAQLANIGAIVDTQWCLVEIVRENKNKENNNNNNNNNDIYCQILAWRQSITFLLYLEHS